MEISTVPTYEEVFGQPAPTIESLIGNYSSYDVLAYLSCINTQIYFGDENDLEFQKELLLKLINHWRQDIRSSFIRETSAFLSKNQNTEPNFFKPVYVTFFIHNELLNFRENGIDYDSLGEANTIKAYFLYLKLHGEQNPIFEKPSIDDPLKYQKLTWCYVIKQFDFTEKIDPIYQSIRMAKFLEHLYLKPEYKDKVNQYLQKYNKQEVYSFVMDFLAFINVGHLKREDVDLYHSLINESPGFEEIFNNLSVDFKEYQNTPNLQLDYKGVRSKPLLKYKNGTYTVLSWKFLNAAVYLGVIFDFCKVTNSDFGKVKQLVGLEIAEQKIFRGIMNSAFQGKYRILNFDLNNSGHPDFYLRIGSYVYLFEFKDVLMPINIVSTNSFDEFRSYIDDRFIKRSDGKSKGLSQISEQIKIIEAGGFDFDKYQQKSIKTRNLTIIPIIVTTQYNFQMGGINTYLNQQNIIGPSESFKTILPLTLIDLSFFYKQMLRLQEKETVLIDLIRNYHKHLKDNKANMFKSNISFHESFPKSFGNTPPQRDEKFIETLMKAVDIDPTITAKTSK
jgi:hypothetical protein